MTKVRPRDMVNWQTVASLIYDNDLISSEYVHCMLRYEVTHKNREHIIGRLVVKYAKLKADEIKAELREEMKGWKKT